MKQFFTIVFFQDHGPKWIWSEITSEKCTISMSTVANLHIRQTQNSHFCFQDHGLKWLWYQIASDRKHDIHVNSY